jgi:hypothetical protein
MVESDLTRRIGPEARTPEMTGPVARRHGVKMRTLAIASAAVAVGLGGVAVAHPADKPHIGHCHASVAKPKVEDKGPAAQSRGGNNRSVTSGVDLHCK